MQDIAEIKRRLFLTFSLLIFFISPGQSQNLDPDKKHDTIFSITKLVPLEAQEPTTTTIESDNLSDSLSFRVILISDSMTLKFHNKLMNITSINQLDKFIKNHDIARVSSKILIESSEKTSNEKIEEVIQVFTDNKITRFGLIKQ